MTRAQREAIILRNLPANTAQLAHILSSAEHARVGLESLRHRGVVEEVDGVWRRREDVRVWRRDAESLRDGRSDAQR